ncbi:MAG: tyrosine-type recombinase/integrase [Plesiomonas shigelloides]
MAYFNIVKRPRADGTPRWRCTVGVKEGGKHLYRESKTFGKEALAKSWGKRKVLELENSGVPDQHQVSKITFGELITIYMNDPTTKGGRTKEYTLRMLIDCEVAAITLTEITVQHIIEHCRNRVSAGAGPVTVGMDVTYMAGVLDAAKPIYGIQYTDNPAREARPMLNRMGLIGKSQRRSRRPKQDELELLEDGLRKRQQQEGAKIPFVDILRFSILSCMRIGEICKICWDDINESQRAVLVRDRKDPRKKEGNHMLVPLLGEAWDIVQKQPRTEERIFPYNSRSVTAGFQRVRNALGITDLRYHDMRREGASRLFEAGFSIEEVAQVTGHRSLNVLWQVYTELYPKSLHDKYNDLQKNTNK